MFRRRKNKELEKIRAELDRRTADYKGEDIWDLRQFLMLLNLADNDKVGKSKAVIYAYKLGHQDGDTSALERIKKYLAKKEKN